MGNLLTELGMFTYDRYLNAFEDWATNCGSSAPNPSPALIEYTRLNWARSRRLQKTLTLKENLKEAILQLRHHYTWMVLTEGWCGDSAQNLPVIAEMAKVNPEKIKLYILLRDENLELMDNYRTKGARAIPKLIAINDTTGKEAFIWGPRPKFAQDMLYSWKEKPNGLSWDDFEKKLHAWYARDKTLTLQEEFLSIFQEVNKALPSEQLK